MKTSSKILTTSGIAVMGAAIYIYYKKQLNFIKNITYQVDSVKVVSWSAEQVVLQINARAFNSSNLSGTIKELYLDVYLNNIYLGHVQQTQNIQINAQGFANIPVTFTFNPTEVGLNILTLAQETLIQKTLNVQIKGYITIKSGILKAKAPFDYNTSNLIK